MPYYPHAPAGHRLRGLQLDLYVNLVDDSDRLSEGQDCVMLVDVVDEHRDGSFAAYVRRPEARSRALTADAVHDLDEGDGHGDFAVALAYREASMLGPMPPILLPWRLIEGEPHLAGRVAAGPVVVPVLAEAELPFRGQTFHLHDRPLFGEPTWRPITDPA